LGEKILKIFIMVSPESWFGGGVFKPFFIANATIVCSILNKSKKIFQKFNEIKKFQINITTFFAKKSKSTIKITIK